MRRDNTLARKAAVSPPRARQQFTDDACRGHTIDLLDARAGQGTWCVLAEFSADGDVAAGPNLHLIWKERAAAGQVRPGQRLPIGIHHEQMAIGKHRIERGEYAPRLVLVHPLLQLRLDRRVGLAQRFAADEQSRVGMDPVDFLTQEAQVLLQGFRAVHRAGPAGLRQGWQSGAHHHQGQQQDVPSFQHRHGGSAELANMHSSKL